MSVRKHIVVIALATLAAPAVFAQSASVFVGGEAGWVDRPVQSRLTPEQVRNEFLQFRANPLDASGGQVVGGEAGYMFPAHTYARVDGQWVCTDKIAHNPAPAAIKSEGEQRAFQQQYPA
jgi:hypothetical protein